MPGVAAAGINTGMHPLGSMWTIAEVPGQPADSNPVEVHHVSAGYIDAMNIQLMTGRRFTDSDVDQRQPVALVNEALRSSSSRRRAAARPCRAVAATPATRRSHAAADTFEIVGVVRDTLNTGLSDPVMPEVYVPFTETGASNQLVVRTEGDPAGLTRAIVGQVYAIDAGQPVTQVRTLDAILQRRRAGDPEIQRDPALDLRRRRIPARGRRRVRRDVERRRAGTA